MVWRARTIFSGADRLLEVLANEGQQVLGPGSTVSHVSPGWIGEFSPNQATKGQIQCLPTPPHRSAPPLYAAARHALCPSKFLEGFLACPSFPTLLNHDGSKPHVPEEKPRQIATGLATVFAPEPLDIYLLGQQPSFPDPAHRSLIPPPADTTPPAARARHSNNRPTPVTSVSEVLVEGSKNAASGGCFTFRRRTLPRPGVGRKPAPLVFLAAERNWAFRSPQSSAYLGGNTSGDTGHG